MGLCGVVMGLLLQADWPLWAAVGATLLLGALLGAFNGFCVAYLRLAPFLVTLGTLSVFRSAALIVSNNQVVYSFGHAEAAVLALGGGRTFGIANVFYCLVVLRDRPPVHARHDPLGPVRAGHRRQRAGDAAERHPRARDQALGLRLRRAHGRRHRRVPRRLAGLGHERARHGRRAAGSSPAP
jgi:hypothetical protein